MATVAKRSWASIVKGQADANGNLMNSEAAEFVPGLQSAWNVSAPEFAPPVFQADAAEFVPKTLGSTPWTCAQIQSMLEDFDDEDSDSDSEGEDGELAAEKASPRSSCISTSASDIDSDSDFEQNAKHIQAFWETMEAPPMLADMRPPPGLEHLGRWR
mmetsp:Transcript_16807/g.29512  ORF Transcript_16807/g.29512 Transcript_16807/m.29512 type:complete len:158 (-) Transcript_16807:144-617(-)